MYVLSETSGEDFTKGDAYKIIPNKAINKKINCAERTIDDELAEYFTKKGTMNLSKKVNPKKPRIVKIVEKA